MRQSVHKNEASKQAALLKALSEKTGTPGVTADDEEEASATTSNSENSHISNLGRAAVNTWNKIPTAVQIAIGGAAGAAMAAAIPFGTKKLLSFGDSSRNNGGAASAQTTRRPVVFPDPTWNRRQVADRTNCYGYARNDPAGNSNSPNSRGFGLPYHVTRLEYFYDLTCENLLSAVLLDGLIDPASGPAKCEPPCPPGYHSVFTAIAPDLDAKAFGVAKDFHWMRKNDHEYEVGSWSHKLGFGARPENKDASDNVITCPTDADQHYTHYIDGKHQWMNYSSPCGYLCAPDNPDKPGFWRMH